jgi:hypothetical protein
VIRTPLPQANQLTLPSLNINFVELSFWGRIIQIIANLETLRHEGYPAGLSFRMGHEARGIGVLRVRIRCGSKGALVFMSEQPLSPVSPSPASDLSPLDSQFSALDMSSDTPNNPDSSSNVVAPLPAGTRMALLKCLETFMGALGKVPDSGHLSHACYTFENSVTVRSHLLFLFFIFSLFRSGVLPVGTTMRP